MTNMILFECVIEMFNPECLHLKFVEVDISSAFQFANSPVWLEGDRIPI